MLKKLRPNDPVSYGLAVLSGLLLGFSYPPFGLATGFLAFVGLVPILIALDRSTRLKQSVRTLLVGMFFFGLAATWWVGGWSGVGEVDPFLMLGGVILMIVHPFFLIVPLVLYDVLRRRVGHTPAFVLLPIFYAGFEYWHSLGQVPFPWLSLYNSQTYNTAFIQFIALTGPYVLTMLIVVVNILIYLLLRKQTSSAARLLEASALLLLFVCPYIYGFRALSEPEHPSKTLTMSIVQPNINPWAKWQSDRQRIMDTNYAATTAAVMLGHGKTQLMIWPETAIPFQITLPSSEYYLRQFYQFEDSLHLPILTGFPDEEFYFRGNKIPDDAKSTGVDGVSYRSWNAAMLSYKDQSGRHLERYHKQILVPLGEHVPFIDEIPILGKIFSWGVGLGSWNVGRGYDYFTLPVKNGANQVDTAKLATLICYESIYPSFVRHFADLGAEALIVITNDGWYGNSPGPYQHNQFAVLRAIENHRWTLRCANTGISSVIDDRGRFIAQTDVFKQTSLTYPIPLNDGKTFYTEYGDFIAVPCEWITGLAALYFFVGWIGSRRRRKLSNQRDSK